MAPKHNKQPAFLLFLRSVGYKEELPPSTVAWLENAPVFKFLASKLSKDNFVSSEDQQEFNEIMLAKGPNADLYDALGSGSDDDDDEEPQQQHSGQEQHWMGDGSDADVQRQVQAKEQYVQHLEQQIAALKALSGQLDASTRAQRQKQPMYMALQSQANHDLAAARAEAAQLNTELNAVLQGLGSVCSELAGLAEEQPQQWLLSAADLGVYGEQDEVARQLFDRAMRLLNAADVVRQLDPTAATGPGTGTPAASPAGKRLAAGASPHKAAAAAAAAGAVGPSGFPTALLTPRQQKQAGAGQQLQQQQLAQQQQQPMLSPRGRGRSNREDALLDADIRRHADQEARNAALLRELTRQRLAFKLALDELLRAEVAEAGTKGQLAAARDVKAGTGGFARLKKMGPPCLAQLSSEVSALETTRQLLGSEEVPALTEDLARLNDTYIVAGDYARQLAKMGLSAARKQAVLHSLLGVTSRHLLLLLLGSQEASRLGVLGQEVAAAQQQLEGHLEAVRARVNKCVAAQHVLQQGQQRSNLQPGDSYLLALMAAAEGALTLQDAGPAAAGQASGANAAAAATAVEPATPQSSAAGVLSTPRSARTPSYIPVKHLTDQLQQLSTGMQQRSTELQQLLSDLPQQLESQREAAGQMYQLAFPPGQQGSHLVGTSHAGLGAGSSWGGSSIAGTASVAASVRSMRSTTSSSAASSGLLVSHVLPVLRDPEIAEAQSGLESSVRHLGTELNSLVTKQNELALMLNQHRSERELERSVMRLFFTAPGELPAQLAKLKGEVEALELARELDQD